MQIKTELGISDLDSFLQRNNQQPTPRRSYLNAPKNHHLPLKNYHTKENQPLINNTSRSPARSASKTTLSSHQQEQTSLHLSRQRAKSRKSIKIIKRSCENHEEIQGLYRINIEGDDLFYCEKCANKLKSQGFPVKFEQTGPHRSRRIMDNSECSTVLSSYGYLEGHPQFQILKILLSTIYESESSIKKASENQANIQQICEMVSSEFEQSMDKLEEIIRVNRHEGRKALNKIFSEYERQPQSEVFALENSLKEIEIMKSDIENNIESIVQDVEKQTFKQCVQSYRSRIQELNNISAMTLSHLQEIKSELISVKNSSFQTAREEIEKITRELQEQKNIQMEKEMFCKEGLQPETNQYDKQGPFRNLFQPRIVPRKRDPSRK